MKKNKKIFFIIFVILLVLIIGICSFIFYQKEKERQEMNRLISEIKNSYSQYVTPIKDKKLYTINDNNYQEIGTISKDIVIELVEKDIKDTSDIYYQIKNSNYYIDYKNIKEIEKEEVDLLDKYIVTKIIKTNPTNLYQDDKLKISTNEELEFDVLLKDNDKYYVKFLNDIYYIKDSFELIDKENVNILKDISVLNFSDDISNDKLKEVLKYLKDNNYDTITITDFIRWINGQVNLENNKVLLLSYKDLNNEKMNVVKEYGYTINTDFKDIKFTSGDTKMKIGDTKYYKYEITSNTKIDRVKDMLKGIKEVKVSTSSGGPGVAVLNYHFFYDSSIGEGCNESICLDVKNFRQQLQYLKDNNYKILTMQEFNDWMDRKVTFSQKAVLITVDDGAMGTSFINGNKLIPILEEFQVPATLFLITGWWDVNNYKSNYLEVYSHGDELHHNNFCRNGKCGYKGPLLTKEELKSDLQTSINKIGTNLAFCYPFYAKNNTMIQALKETGFSLAFVGGNRKARQYDNKYSVPRYVIYKNTSLNSFINMVK